MYCEKCGNEINVGANFCKNCGEKSLIKEAVINNIEANMKDEKSSKPESSGNIFSGILSVVIFVLAIALGRFMGLVAFLLYLSFYAGQKISKWYIKRKNFNKSVVNFISWSNVITWIFPILGLFTAAWAIESGEVSEDNNKKYLILGYGASILSVINSIAGIIIKS